MATATVYYHEKKRGKETSEVYGYVTVGTLGSLINAKDVELKTIRTMLLMPRTASYKHCSRVTVGSVGSMGVLNNYVVVNAYGSVGVGTSGYGTRGYDFFALGE